MAKPIKETPVLTGKDALIFRERANNVKKISQTDRERMLSNYKKLNQRENF